MKKILVLILFVLSHPAFGCANTRPGSVQSTSDTPMVTVTAGKVFSPGAGFQFASYVIDPQTRTCWLRIGQHFGALQCHSLLGVPAVARYLTWLAAPAAGVAVDENPADLEPPPAPAPRQGGGAAAVDL